MCADVSPLVPLCYATTDPTVHFPPLHSVVPLRRQSGFSHS